MTDGDPDKGEVLSLMDTLRAMTEMAQLAKETEAPMSDELRERKRATSVRWRLANPDRVAAYQAAYRAANRDALSAGLRERRAALKREQEEADDE
jgi:hypothetical protein